MVLVLSYSSEDIKHLSIPTISRLTPLIGTAAIAPPNLFVLQVHDLINVLWYAIYASHVPRYII